MKKQEVNAEKIDPSAVKPAPRRRGGVTGVADQIRRGDLSTPDLIMQALDCLSWEEILQDMAADVGWDEIAMLAEAADLVKGDTSGFVPITVLSAEGPGHGYTFNAADPDEANVLAAGCAAGMVLYEGKAP